MKARTVHPISVMGFAARPTMAKPETHIAAHIAFVFWSCMNQEYRGRVDRRCSRRDSVKTAYGCVLS